MSHTLTSQWVDFIQMILIFKCLAQPTQWSLLSQSKFSSSAQFIQPWYPFSLTLDFLTRLLSLSCFYKSLLLSPFGLLLLCWLKASFLQLCSLWNFDCSRDDSSHCRECLPRCHSHSRHALVLLVSAFLIFSQISAEIFWGMINFD